MSKSPIRISADVKLAPFDAVGIADPARGLFPGAVQEHRQQFAAAPLHDGFEVFVLRAVVGRGVAEGGDEKRNAVLRGGVDARAPGAMDQLPESGRAEVEDGKREIDRHMIVEQPPRHHAKQRFCHRQFTGRGRAVE